LISDERVLQFDWLPVHKLSYGQKQTLLDPILDRLVRLSASENLRPYYTLASRLRQIPETAFRNPDPRIDRLLAKLETRRNAAALIKALAFRGPAEADRLLSFVIEGSQQNSRERIDHFGEDVDAALRGLCHMGGSAQKVLPKMHQMAAEGSVSEQRQESDLWRATLIALGENVEQFDLPPNRKWRTELYRRSLSRMAANRCEER